MAHVLRADGSAAELARILRLPGTHNVKYPSDPVPVSIVSLEEDRQYNLSDFELFLPATQVIQRSNPSGWISQALNELQEGKRNTTFAKIGGRLHHDGWQQEDILAILTPHAQNSGLSLDELRQEITGICRRYPNNNSFPSSSYNREETETESKPFEALPLSKFMEAGEQTTEWCVEKIIPKGGASILAGPAGYGKSWMILDVAIECARGGTWLGKFPVKRMKSLLIDEESSAGLLRKRTNKLLGAKQLKGQDLDIHFCVGQGLCFNDPASVGRLRCLLDSLRPGLVIIDSLIRVHKAEENSASEMSQVFAVVKGLIREFDCTFLFTDHQRKPGHFGISQDLLLRGSSEKAAFVDTLLSLHKKDDSLIIEHSKSRYDEAVAAFVVRIEDKTPDTTTVSYVGEAEALKQEARQEAARDFITAALKAENWIARKALIEQAKESGISEKAVDETLKALEAEGTIEREDRKPEGGRGGKAAFYRWMPIPLSSHDSIDRETETE